MASRGRRSGRSADNKLFEKGVVATILGIAFLSAPLVLGSSPMLRPVAQGLRFPAWIALGVGIALLVVDRVVNAAKAKAAPQVQPSAYVAPGSTDMFPREIPAAPGGSAEHLDRTAPAQAVPALTMPRAKSSRWEKQVFELIEWRRFEAVCERLFMQAGFQTKSQSHGADGGVDIWLYSRNSEGPAAVVQCKHWGGRAVGVKELREFLGAMTSKSVKRGTYATTSTFTSAASDFAKENGIHLLDRDGLLALIGKRSDAQQQELLDVAFEGEYWRPTCASCGVKMVERTSSKDQKSFWGCVNFPRCRSTLPAR